MRGRAGAATGASVDGDLPEQVDVREHRAGPERDRVERQLGDRDREAGLLAQAPVEVLQERAAAREDDPLVHDVGRELGRRLLEGDADGVDDDPDRLRERLAHLGVGQREGLRDPLDEVAPLDLHRERLVEREGRADLDLDLLGGPLADEEVVLPLDVLDDRLVHLVRGDADRLGVDDAGERDDGDVGRAAADVDDHVPGRLGDRRPDADGGRHRLLDDEDLAGARLERRVLHRPLLDLRDVRRDRDDDPRPHERRAAVRLLDEVVEHLLGDLEVGDDAVLHRADGDDVPGRPAEHLLGRPADRLDPVGDAVDGDDGGLADDDPASLGEDEGVGGAEVDGEVGGEPREE